MGVHVSEWAWMICRSYRARRLYDFAEMWAARARMLEVREQKERDRKY